MAFFVNIWSSCQSKGVISFWRARAGSEIVRLARKRARFGKAGLWNSAELRMLLSGEEDGVSAPSDGSSKLLKVVSVFFWYVGGLSRPRFLASDGPRRDVQARVCVLCGSCIVLTRKERECRVWQFRTLVSLILVVLRMGASQRSHALPCWRWRRFRRAPATGQPCSLGPSVGKIRLDRYYFLIDVVDSDVVWPFGHRGFLIPIC